MASGGKRAGAGRPKGASSKSTLRAIKVKDLLSTMYVKEAKAMFAAQIERAKKGDTSAFRELNDRMYGKAQQAVDLTSGNEPFTLIFGNAGNNVEQDGQTD
jgi:hypothetical protein